MIDASQSYAPQHIRTFELVIPLLADGILRHRTFQALRARYGWRWYSAWEVRR